MSEEVKIEESSGNVFLDIGFPKAEAEREQLRVDLVVRIHHLLEELKLTPAKAEEHFGLDPSDVSQIQNGDFSFNLDKLFAILNQLNRNIEIRITPSDEKSWAPASCFNLRKRFLNATQGSRLHCNRREFRHRARHRS
ncbi:MAG: XRE family transcriptional regulator [Candidatus Poribacteria bacterium]|nr:XRE family transcriptional regulator [Candidatus Poribacteria bacterium]